MFSNDALKMGCLPIKQNKIIVSRESVQAIMFSLVHG